MVMKCREGHARGAGSSHVLLLRVCVCVVVVFGLYFFFGVRHKSLRSILKKQVPCHISMKTISCRHIALRVSVSYLRVGSHEPLIFLLLPVLFRSYSIFFSSRC